LDETLTNELVEQITELQKMNYAFQQKLKSTV